MKHCIFFLTDYIQSNFVFNIGAIDVLVVDSVAALVPRAEIEGEMGDSHVGLQARLMSLKAIAERMKINERTDNIQM